MSKEPILTTIYDNTKERIIVKGGLHYLKGNAKPYFTITAELPGLGMYGCCHDEIKKAFGTRFDDLIALHLSDIYGAPMHAAANAFYHAGGTGHWELTQTGIFKSGLESLLKRHGKAESLGDAQRLLGLDDPAQDRVWKRWEGTPNAEHVASHLRISVEEADRLIDEVEVGRFTAKDMEAYAETLKPRWQIEADACIANHNLQIFGDDYNPSK